MLCGGTPGQGAFRQLCGGYGDIAEIRNEVRGTVLQPAQPYCGPCASQEEKGAGAPAGRPPAGKAGEVSPGPPKPLRPGHKPFHGDRHPPGRAVRPEMVGCGSKEKDALCFPHHSADS